ncbi:MAG: helix-turn-helix domain-containing protein [Myxococcales bacterium]|nr:helix-turn-helix domain-containing protein [Myxococcales bacterium]
MLMAETAAMTVREVATYLNVNEKTVYRLAQKRDLPGFKVAGAWRFRREDIDRWIEKQTADSLGQGDEAAPQGDAVPTGSSGGAKR